MTVTVLYLITLAFVVAFFFERVLSLNSRADEDTRLAEEVACKIFLSREALQTTVVDRNVGLSAAFSRRIEPEIADIKAALEGLLARTKQGEAAETPELDALMKRLESLRSHEIRAQSHLLHPSVIDLCLFPAVRMLARSFRETFELELVVDASFRASDVPGRHLISRKTRLNAYRCLEHALEDLAEHAQARQVRLSLSVPPGKDCLVIDLKDDGLEIRSGLRAQVIEGRVAALRARLPSHPLPKEERSFTSNCPCILENVQKS